MKVGVQFRQLQVEANAARQDKRLPSIVWLTLRQGVIQRLAEVAMNDVTEKGGGLVESSLCSSSQCRGGLT